MSTTITEIQSVVGEKFTGKLNKYVDSSPATYYVLSGTTAAGEAFRFILAPTTSIDANPLLWSDGYMRILDNIL